MSLKGEQKANMATPLNLRFTPSSAFARGLDGFRLRLPTQLQPTGISELDALLSGGVPRGSLIELCGSSSSGRTSVSFSLLAAATQRQEACAYVDVSDSLDPLSLASAGVDLARLLWIRCGSQPANNALQSQPQKASLPFLENTGRKHKHSQSWQHPRDQIRGIESALPSIMSQSEAPKNATSLRRPQSATLPFPEPEAVPRITTLKPSSPATPSTNNLRTKKGTPGPWKRLDQALRTTDLLLHSGGWGVVIFDLGGVPWIDARRIELSTWFRFRRTIENTPTILVLLAEESCAKSCSSLVLQCRRKQENWTHLDVQKRTSGMATLDGFQVENKIVSSRTGLPLMDSAQWTANTLWGSSFMPLLFSSCEEA
ncbi:MAG TPA: ATPase domain-containing protein [Verrucomicrobiae bacterium]|nr:ATPase domain-containing protein [Verrucomicrobiae bacterium]